MQYFCELIAKKKETKQSKQTPTRNVSQFTTFYYQLHLERLSFFSLYRDRVGEVYVLFS